MLYSGNEQGRDVLNNRKLKKRNKISLRESLIS
jgi:hypothetical protein